MNMREDERLSGLIAEVYDAAIDPSLWVAVLAKCTEFVGGLAAALFYKDAVSKTGNVAYQYGIEPRFQQLYFEKIIKLDPLTIGHFFAEIEEPVAVAEIIQFDEFLETRAYREWGKPQGIIDVLNVALDKTSTSAAMFCVFRHERDGRVDDEMRRRMRLIVPHLRRAVLIGRVIDLKTAKAAAFANTLDGLSAGMFLVDASSRIVHANAAGLASLNARDLFHSAGGRLVANDPDIDQTLRDIFMAARDGDASVGTKGIAVALTSRDRERYVAHVLPLTSGARSRAGSCYAAVAALFVHKAALDAPSWPETIAKAYKLTPTELRVLLAVVEIGGVPEVAEALGIGESTVKTHLKRLYEKTSTRRQVDLVKLVAGYSSPLAG
jgi:DNA-binding CsgD family transcriptional regulator